MVRIARTTHPSRRFFTMRTIQTLTALLFSLTLAACGGDKPAQSAAAADTAPDAPSATDAVARLAEVLEAQPEETKARYPYRNPAQTLAFFGIEPGMTVVETLPGGGWYSKILLPYLGADGQLIGVNYPQAIFRLFGFMSEEQVVAQQTWPADWSATAEGWRGEGDAPVSAFVFGGLPDELRGTADAVLVIRTLHNLARFDDQGGFLGLALQDIHDVLKPGGIVGVVQHEARPEMPDEWAAGQNGYLKRSFVIDAFRSAGFELEAESDINENPLDQPTTEDVVWRLPPNLRMGDDEARREEMKAVGESHRMTLKFRKSAD
jgi:predicted methyltransferase